METNGPPYSMINLKQQKLTHSYGLSVEQFPIDFDKLFETALNCFTSLCDLSRKLVPHFNQSDPKLKKTNHDLVIGVFPRSERFACFYFDLS